MTQRHESTSGELDLAVPLDVYRALSSYEGSNPAASAHLGIAAELFDGDECMASVDLFVESSRRGMAIYSSLGPLSMADGIDVDGLADLYQRRGSNELKPDHEAVVANLMGDAFLAVAVSQTALRGITTEYLRHRYEWSDEDTALQRAIGRAGIDSSVYERNNFLGRPGYAPRTGLPLARQGFSKFAWR